MDYPFCNRSVNLFYVVEDRTLIVNPKYQGGFSSPARIVYHHPCPADVQGQ
jgi:hypothetical protein